MSRGHAVLGLDGAYVRDRHLRPARTFEVVVGQVRGAADAPTRFAFVRQGSAAGAATSKRCTSMGSTQTRASPSCPMAMPACARCSARPRPRRTRSSIGFTLREHQELWGVWLSSHGDSRHRPAYAPPGEAPMRWTVVLVAETEAGQRIEEPVLSLVRDPRVVAGALGPDARRRQAAPAGGPAADGGRAGEATRSRLSALRPLQAKIVHQRLPAPMVPVGVRQGAHPRAAIDVLSLSGRASADVLVVTAVRRARSDRARNGSTCRRSWRVSSPSRESPSCWGTCSPRTRD